MLIRIKVLEVLGVYKIPKFQNHLSIPVLKDQRPYNVKTSGPHERNSIKK